MLRSRHVHRPESLDADRITELASELGGDRDLVEEIYRSEIDGLAQSASLQEYVPLFAARRTRDRLKRIRTRRR